MEQEKNEQIRFEYSGWRNRDVTVIGIPELEGMRGLDMGEKMAIFWGEDYEMYVVNTETGKLRKFSDAAGHVLVALEDIDLESIKRHCPEGLSNAKNRTLEYAHMNRYTDFKNGIAAISWTLYPDGRYFEDEDGFGGESNREETVYCVINRNLEIIRPFAYVPDVKAMLKEVAKNK